MSTFEEEEAAYFGADYENDLKYDSYTSDLQYYEEESNLDSVERKAGAGEKETAGEAITRMIDEKKKLMCHDLTGCEDNADTMGMRDLMYVQRARTLLGLQCFVSDEEGYRIQGQAEEPVWADLYLKKKELEDELDALRNENENGAGLMLSNQERLDNSLKLAKCYIALGNMTDIFSRLQQLHHLQTDNDDVLKEQASKGALVDATYQFYKHTDCLPDLGKGARAAFTEEVKRYLRRFNLKVSGSGVLYSRKKEVNETKCATCGGNLSECRRAGCQYVPVKKKLRDVHCRVPINQDLHLMCETWGFERDAPTLALRKDRLGLGYTPTLQSTLPLLFNLEKNPGTYVLYAHNAKRWEEDISKALIQAKYDAVGPLYTNNQCFSCLNGVLNTFDTSIQPNEKGHRSTFKTFDELEAEGKEYNCGVRLSDCWYEHVFDDWQNRLLVFTDILSFQGYTKWEEYRLICAPAGAGILRSGKICGDDTASGERMMYPKAMYMVYLVGEAGTGKSEFVKAIKTLFTDSDTCNWACGTSSAFPLEKCGVYRGDHYRLKSLQYCYEWGDDMIQADNLKSLIVGESQMANGKFKTEAMLKGQCCMYFCGNKPVNMANDYGELDRRIAVTPFMNRVPHDKVDTTLQERIKAQAGLFADVCVRSCLELHELLKDKKGSVLRQQDNAIRPEVFRKASRILSENNPCFRFLKEPVVFEHDQYYPHLDCDKMEVLLDYAEHKYMTLEDFVIIFHNWGQHNKALSKRVKESVAKMDADTKGLKYALEDMKLKLVELKKKPWFNRRGTGADEPEDRRAQTWILGIGLRSNKDASGQGIFDFDALYSKNKKPERPPDVEEGKEDFDSESEMEEWDLDTFNMALNGGRYKYAVVEIYDAEGHVMKKCRVVADA